MPVLAFFDISFPFRTLSSAQHFYTFPGRLLGRQDQEYGICLFGLFCIWTCLAYVPSSPYARSRLSFREGESNGLLGGIFSNY